jgi:hypothetical protein
MQPRFPDVAVQAVQLGEIIKMAEITGPFQVDIGPLLHRKVPRKPSHSDLRFCAGRLVVEGSFRVSGRET